MTWTEAALTECEYFKIDRTTRVEIQNWLLNQIFWIDRNDNTVAVHDIDRWMYR
jgi:hypothetical protein